MLLLHVHPRQADWERNTQGESVQTTCVPTKGTATPRLIISPELPLSTASYPLINTRTDSSRSITRCIHTHPPHPYLQAHTSKMPTVNISDTSSDSSNGNNRSQLSPLEESLRSVTKYGSMFSANTNNPSTQHQQTDTRGHPPHLPPSRAEDTRHDAQTRDDASTLLESEEDRPFSRAQVTWLQNRAGLSRTRCCLL